MHPCREEEMATPVTSSTRAKFTIRDWLAFNATDLQWAAVLIGGMMFFGFVMSYDLPVLGRPFGQ
jgi:hypothetical protein